MSGGYFNYNSVVLIDVADSIDELISNNDSDEKDSYGCPIGNKFSPETIAKMMQTYTFLITAAEMMRTVDYLVSGDYSETSFHDKWNSKIKPLIEKIKAQ